MGWMVSMGELVYGFWFIDIRLFPSHTSDTLGASHFAGKYDRISDAVPDDSVKLSFLADPKSKVGTRNLKLET